MQLKSIKFNFSNTFRGKPRKARGEFHFFNTSDYAQLLCAGEIAA